MTDATIRPLSCVSRDQVERYLVARGSRPDMIAWKYFDGAFNRGRERGLVWLHRGDVRGFIGLIPFRLYDGQATRDAVWTCDWSLEDPRRSPGMGIRLLRAAIDRSPLVMSLGGNELTRALLPRIAAQTIEAAGAVFILPLRLGYVLEKIDGRIARRVRGVPALAGTPLALLPLPSRSGGGENATIEPGISRKLEPMLAQREENCSSAAYDFEHLDWQCGRCPEIEAWTCLAPTTAPGERSGAVVFRRRSAPSHWRMVWWLESGAGPHAIAVLRGARTFVHERSGLSLSVMISASDEQKATLLRAQGFHRERGGHPLYVSASDHSAPFTPLREVRGISYLDTDLPHLP